MRFFSANPQGKIRFGTFWAAAPSPLVIVHITNLAIPLSLAPKFKIILTFYGEIYE